MFATALRGAVDVSRKSRTLGGKPPLIIRLSPLGLNLRRQLHKVINNCDDLSLRSLSDVFTYPCVDFSY
jgi:hypothetical protein